MSDGDLPPPLLYWKDDDNRQTLWMLVVVCVMGFVAWLLIFNVYHSLTDHHHEPSCTTPNQVLVEVVHTTLSWQAGDLRCVNAENIGPTTKEK